MWLCSPLFFILLLGEFPVVLFAMSRQLTILYGSETGTAQDFAESIWRESKKFHFEGFVKALNSYEAPSLINEKLVVFVCATTGVGEEPENMKIFWKFLLRKSLPGDSLSGLRFAVIGFGDSGYEKFNFVAKKLHKRLIQLGGIPLLDLALCDDQHDLGPSFVYLPWLTSLWNKVTSIYPLPSEKSPLAISPMEIRWNIETIDEDKENDSRVRAHQDCLYKKSCEVHLLDGVSLKLLTNERTTDEDHFQDVRLLSFDAKKLSWSPGDILNVRPQNRQTMVDDFFALMEELQVPIYPETMVRITKKSDGKCSAVPIRMHPTDPS